MLRERATAPMLIEGGREITVNVGPVAVPWAVVTVTAPLEESAGKEVVIRLGESTLY